jgi:rSAM/selenodomain-associated transferase 1
MAKAPIAGVVKTRLIPPLSPAEAAELARALLVDQLMHLKSITDAACYLAYTPEDSKALMQEIAGPGWQLVPQGGADLGARMAQVFTDLWGRGHRSLVLLGGDLPALPVDHIRSAFGALATHRHQAVLGPTADGGYCLVGLNQPAPWVFSGMTWSHDGVLQETMQRLSECGVDYLLLPEWFDIDTVNDLRRLQQCDDPATRRAMPRTFTFLGKLAW